MRRFFRIVLAVFAMSFMGHNVSAENADSIAIEIDSILATVDSIVADPDPEWYVSPDSLEVRLAARRRMVKASSCTLDSICTFDIDSILKEVTVYEHVGDTNRTIVWTINSDGSRVGKSKTEDVSTTMHIFHATYGWDDVANTWSGTEKLEYFYNYFYGVRKLESGTSFTWENGAWVADSRYTYNFNESLQEIEYYEYTRNAFTNQLEYSKGRIQTWIDETRRSLEILYTAYSNGNWIAGTKKEWVYDANDNQTLYAYYNAISNGNWVGSLKETWTYGGPTGELTLHEKYGWASSDWSKTLKEETEYSGAKIIRVESYTYANGVPTGTKKETWTYGGPSGQLTLHEQFGWVSSDWSKTLKEETQYSGANVIRIENYTYANGVPTGTKKELTTYTSGKKTQILTFAWENGDWVNSNRETWEFNGPSSKQTKHEKCEWENGAWTIMVQENTTYNSNTTIVENYERIEGVLTGTKKESNTVVSGKPTETITYDWNGSWVESTKENWAYTNNKLTKHEFYEWTGDWTKTLEENTTYSGSNITKIENYERVEGVWTGTQKEEYAYTSGQKTSSIVYAWDAAASDWVEESREAWGFTSGKQTLYETYSWNGNWVKTLQENTTYDGENITKIENYALVEGVWAGTQKEEYTYTSGEKTRTIVSVWVENDWVFSTKNEAGYQVGNTEVSEINYTWNGSTWIGTGGKIEITKEGEKTILVLGYTWDDEIGDWGYNARRVYAYDSKGREVGDTTYHYINSQWENYKLQTHGYDKWDHDTLAITATWNGTEWEATYISKGTYTYTAAGNPLLVETYTGIEGDWTGGQKIVYTYVTIKNVEKQTCCWQYEWKKGKWTNKSRATQEYDSNGNQTLSMGEKWQSNKWVGQYRYEYGFDASNNQTKQAQYTWSGSAWRGLSRTDYGYIEINEKTYVAYTISFTWASTDWAYRKKTEYIRDDKGRAIDQKISVYQSNAWVNDQWDTWRYDSRDQEISTWEYYWIDGKWTPVLCSEKTYDEADNKLRREINGSWNNGVLQYYTDNLLFYDCDPHSYTIRFVNDDGAFLASVKIAEGEIPAYNGATPTKSADVQYSYTFKGWDKTIVAATANTTYTATYTATTRSYTITWQNEDGTELSHETLEYGKTPEHAAPTKENTVEWTYTFTGWDPAIESVNGDASYKATFSQTKNKYLITFKNGETELQSSEVEFGTVPVYEGATPVKDEDAQYTYDFAGWDHELVAVTGAKIYTATFSGTVKKYAITFQNYDETVLQSSEVAYGETPEYTGETPTKPADAQDTYNFAGWDPQVVPVTGTATYTAQYTSTVNSYTIKFMNGETELQSSQVAYGELPVYTGAKPTKDATAQYTYDFSGWDSEIVAVTGAKTYNATFTSTVNSYVITFMNGEDILQTGEVAYGETPAYTGATPTKPADAQDTYTFAGWSPEIVSVTGTATYTATFTGTTNKYLITFKNGETELQSSEVDYGVTPVYSGATPTKPADAQYTYTFSGWNPAIVAVTGIATYEAQFSSTVNKYTIKFMNGETELQSSEVEYGTEPVYGGATPTKDATAQYTYTFSGWDKEITSVTGNEIYTAQFSSEVNSYTITWLNDDDSQITQETLEYGATPSHVDAEKENTAEWTYAFTGWTPAIESVKGDASYKATFSQTKNSYTVTWVDENDIEISHETLEYGATPSHADMSKDNTAEWTYNFEGWTPAIVDVTGDATYKATFSQTKNSYTVTWVDDNDTEISQETLEYGATPSHADASKDNTAEWTYSFTGWTPAITSVTGDATYKANFSQTKNTYTITFLNYDGTELQTGDVEYGVVPTYTSATPTKPADAQGTYTFAGWDEEIAAVTGAKTYTATFTGVKGTYTITFYFGDGVTILSQMELAYGEMPEMTLEPARLSDPEFSYTFAGWEPAIAPVTADADYVAVYTATTNSYTIIFRNDDGTELQRNVLDYGILPIYAGEEPTKEEDERYTYEFAGWKPAVDIAKADAIYTATYTATKKKKQGIEDVVEAGAQATKIYIEGNIYILRAGHAYAPDGTKLY